MGSSCAESAFTQYRRNKIHSKQIKTVPSFEIGQIIDSKGHPIRLSLLSYQLENISFSTQVVLIKIEILHDMLLVEGLRIPFSLDVDLEDDATAQAQDQCPPHQFNRVVLVGITNIGCGTHIIQQVLKRPFGMPSGGAYVEQGYRLSAVISLPSSSRTDMKKTC